MSIKANKEHASSKGFHCVKSSAAIDVLYDKDRVLRPLRRVGEPGEFVEVTWDDAIDDIVNRLRAIRNQHGADAFATFMGNPPLFGFATALSFGGFQQALKVRWKYGINSEDASARQAANAILYGSVAMLPKPDLWRTDFALLIGANPMVSHGSLVSEPLFREALESIGTRDGRVVVIDPRRTETARRFEHIPIRAGGDTYLLLGLLHVMVAGGLTDHDFVHDHTTGFTEFKELLAPFDPQTCSAECGIPAEAITSLATDFARAPSAVVYGRTGTCTQRFGTLNNVLQDLLMVLTGNIERPGGLIFGGAVIDVETFARSAGMDTYGKGPSRATGRPDVFGMLPSTALVPDITTPGDGQVRALLTLGANPVNSSAGGGEAMVDALEQLDLHFSIDLYVNDSNKYAHYILPTTHMFEREDFPLLAMGVMLRPAIWATERVVEPPENVRPEWMIFDEIAHGLGYGGAYGQAPLRWLAKMGIRIKPRTLLDVLIRTSPVGDLFGLRRSGLSFAKLLRDHPDGKVIAAELPVGRFPDVLGGEAKPIALNHPHILAEVRKVGQYRTDPRYPLRLHGMRETRSHNSWMHNVERLMPASRGLSARVSPEDALAAGLSNGEHAVITSASGTVTVPVTVTKDMSPGNIALPHGWGHAGGWRHANAAGGVNSNLLASSNSADIEALAGMSILNGIPVRLERVDGVAATSDSS